MATEPDATTGSLTIADHYDAKLRRHHGATDAPAVSVVDDRPTGGPDQMRYWMRCGFGRRRTLAEGDAIAAARRRLPMMGLHSVIALIGPDGPVTQLGVLDGR